MTHVPHTLTEEFPEHLNTIMTLRSVDLHFARLAEEYHKINRQIHRVETRLEPMGDLEELELRKTRAELKDQIWKLLRRAEAQLTS